MSTRRMILMALFAAIAACGPSGAGPVEPAAGEGAAAITGEPVQGLVEEEVTFEAAGTTIRGTISGPESPGRHPGLLLIAGSGPTDRNWVNPLIPGTNGSGRLLAQDLSRRGVVVLRYDKRGTGESGAPPTTTMDDYLAEQRAALELLRARPEVDGSRIFVAGHSEGGVHALRLVRDAGGSIKGLLLLSAMGQSMAATVVRQVGAQFQALVDAGQIDQAMADGETAKLRGALDDLVAGNDVAAEHVSAIPAVAQLVAMFAAPEDRELARGLLSFDPAAAFAGLSLPVLVLNGDKDLQIRPDTDAQPLADAARAAGLADVELVVVPNANHVYKREEAPFESLTPEAGNFYNADDRVLEPGVVSAIVGWLQRVDAQ